MKMRQSHRCVSPLAPMLAAIVTLTGCGERARVEGPWEFKVDSSGARPAASLRSAGKEGPRGEPQKAEAVFSLDCRADHTGATILTAQALRQGSVDVEITLDAERPRKLPGFAGTTESGGQLVLTIPLDSVLTLLQGHRRVTVNYEDGAGSSKTTAIFPVDGLEARRAEFIGACDRSHSDRSHRPR
jgi:hypothetical protein